MRKCNYILRLLFSVLLMHHANAQVLGYEKEKDEFVATVNSGADSALYIGKKLIAVIEAGDSLYVIAPRVYLSMGNYYLDRDRLPAAIKYYQQTMDVAEQLKDSIFIAYANGSMGYVYLKSERYEDALPVFSKNLEIWRQKNNTNLIPVALNNVGRSLIGLTYYDEALNTLLEGYEFCEQNNVKTTQAEIAYQISRVYQLKGNVTLSKEWAEKSMMLIQENQQEQLYKTKLLLASIYLKQEQWKEADTLCLSVYRNLKNEAKYRSLFIQSCECLSKSNRGLGKEQQAMNYHWEYIHEKDSLAARYQIKQLGQLELEHELHKNLMMDSVEMQNQEKELQLNQQLEKDKLAFINWVGVLLFVLIVVTGVYVYQSYKKQKVTFQKLTEVNKEITDSINYAKHIQDAFLPGENALKDLFSSAFLIYKPKDVVAGDFYWFLEQDNKVLLAVADCIQNGVPGAMASVVCQGALHKAARELGLNSTSAILDYTQELVAQRFAFQDTSAEDGMNISLCIIDKETRQLQFSGAHAGLWVRDESNLLKLDGDAVTVGNTVHQHKFTHQQEQLKAGNMVYLFTDGYERQNQAGTDNLEKLILSGKLVQQYHVIVESYEYEHTQTEQQDDFCMIGIQV